MDKVSEILRKAQNDLGGKMEIFEDRIEWTYDPWEKYAAKYHPTDVEAILNNLKSMLEITYSEFDVKIEQQFDIKVGHVLLVLTASKKAATEIGMSVLLKE